MGYESELGSMEFLGFLVWRSSFLVMIFVYLDVDECGTVGVGGNGGRVWREGKFFDFLWWLINFG